MYCTIKHMANLLGSFCILAILRSSGTPIPASSTIPWAGLLRHRTWPIVHNKPVTASLRRRFSRFENIFLASRWNFFRARENTSLAKSQTACGWIHRAWSRRSGLGWVRKESRGVSRTRKLEKTRRESRCRSARLAQSSFRKHLPEERIEKRRYRLRLAENFLERGRWQTTLGRFSFQNKSVCSRRREYVTRVAVKSLLKTSRGKYNFDFNQDRISNIVVYIIFEKSDLIMNLNNPLA